MAGGGVSLEEYGENVQEVRDEVKKAKGQVELSLARDIKDIRKGFSRHNVGISGE